MEREEKRTILILIMGAGGRDFHDFNTLFREDISVDVVAFTAAQIPGIENRRYPFCLAGKLYPQGIPIVSEKELVSLIRKHKIDKVCFAYSDVSYSEDIGRLATKVLAAGADFELIAPQKTMLKSRKPVIAVTAVRTGAGKSQTTRAVVKILKDAGKRVVVVRHPMPYGDLERQRVQRFGEPSDLDKHNCTFEEREEYGPHLEDDTIVYAGVDYHSILRAAEEEADVIVWDGGNNDTPFYVPNYWICVADALRPGHEKKYYPGGINFTNADLIIINKCHRNEARVNIIEKNAKELNPRAKILRAESVIANNLDIEGKSVVIVEECPGLTHGGMRSGAGMAAAVKYRAKVVDPRPHAIGSINQVYKDFPHIGMVIPALGYSRKQITDLKRTINDTPADIVLFATPADLGNLLILNKSYVRVQYNLDEKAIKSLRKLLKKIV